MMNPYRVLGIDAKADFATIHAAYRQLIREHHPDRLSPDGDAMRASEINAAFALLKDPVRRAKWDAEQFEKKVVAEATQFRRVHLSPRQKQGPSLQDRHSRLKQVRLFRRGLLAGACLLVGLGMALAATAYQGAAIPLWDATIRTAKQPPSIQPLMDKLN